MAYNCVDGCGAPLDATGFCHWCGNYYPEAREKYDPPPQQITWGHGPSYEPTLLENPQLIPLPEHEEIESSGSWYTPDDFDYDWTAQRFEETQSLLKVVFFASFVGGLIIAFTVSPVIGLVCLVVSLFAAIVGGLRQITRSVVK